MSLRCRVSDVPSPFARFTPVAEPRTTLIDGTEVSTWSEEWLIECRDRHAEALKVLMFATREIRQAHIARYAERLGDLARERLEAEVMRVWRVRQAALTPNNTTS